MARINDRGPFVEGRVIDLSYALARDLGVLGKGTARVRVEAVAGPRDGRRPSATLEGPFTWQVGAFQVEANARALMQSLRSEFSEVSAQRYDRGDAVFQRVRVGAYASVEEAQAALRPLRARGITPYLVRKD
jgi:rare lipoprotein A